MILPRTLTAALCRKLLPHVRPTLRYTSLEAAAPLNDGIAADLTGCSESGASVDVGLLLAERRQHAYSFLARPHQYRWPRISSRSLSYRLRLQQPTTHSPNFRILHARHPQNIRQPPASIERRNGYDGGCRAIFKTLGNKPRQSRRLVPGAQAARPAIAAPQRRSAQANLNWNPRASRQAWR